MTDEATGAVEAPGAMTKESLFPEGQPGSVERTRNFLKHRRGEGQETAGNEQSEAADEEAEARAEASRDLAEAQETDEQGEEAEEAAQEAALGRMRLKDFLDAAGVSMEEFYRDVVVERDGKEVSVSAAWDDYKSVKEANDALLRERAELQEKANTTATQAPQMAQSPEAIMLANQAQLKLQQISETDWSQVDPGHAANMKFDLQAQANQLWQQAQAKQFEHENKLREQVNKTLAEADRQTRSQIPEWNDQAVRTADQKAIGDMLGAYGIAPQEVDSVIDPRWRKFFRDAMRGRAEKARIEQGAKRIRKVPKTVAPGARVAGDKTPTLEGARAALKQAREQGATRDGMTKARLRVNLPDIKPVKRKRL